MFRGWQGVVFGLVIMAMAIWVSVVASSAWLYEGTTTLSITEYLSLLQEDGVTSEEIDVTLAQDDRLEIHYTIACARSNELESTYGLHGVARTSRGGFDAVGLSLLPPLLGLVGISSVALGIMTLGSGRKGALDE